MKTHVSVNERDDISLRKEKKEEETTAALGYLLSINNSII